MMHNYRLGLRRTMERIRQGELTIGFLGGSITDGRARQNWPEPVVAWFVDRFPGLKVNVENAAIGATASNLAAFRCQRDIIARGCDLVFVDYATNDESLPADQRMRTREGLLRQLLAGEGRDIVIVYTFEPGWYSDIMSGSVPPSVAEFERLADHYGIGSIWMGLHAIDEVKRGRMSWEEWVPDGLHPSVRGSLSYAQSVTAFLERELVAAPNPSSLPTGEKRPAPLDTDLWEHVSLLDFSQVERHGPWAVRRCLNNPWIDRTLETAAVGARLAFSFTGRGLALGFDFGKASSEYRIRLDGGEWTTTERGRPDWCGNDGLFWTDVISESLPAGPHSCELIVVHGDRPECKGTNFRLGFIGLIQ